MIDFNKYKKGNIVRCHCCDNCTLKQGKKPRTPAGSGVESLFCEVCGHYGIGSTRDVMIGDWLALKIL